MARNVAVLAVLAITFVAQQPRLLSEGARHLGGLRVETEPLAGRIEVGESQPLEWLREHCVPIDPGFVLTADLRLVCRVLELAPVAGPGETTLWYALYRWVIEGDYYYDPATSSIYDQAPTNQTAVVLFRARAGGDVLEPLWADARGDGYPGAVFYDAPQRVASPLGELLWIPVRHTGTAHFNEDHWFLAADDDWLLIDTLSWIAELEPWLPADHEIWKGIILDLGSLRAETPLWRSGDANCCPSGGRLEIHFELRDTVLGVSDVRHVPE